MNNEPLLCAPFCEDEGDPEMQHFAGNFQSSYWGRRSVSGYITANEDVFFTEGEPKFCPVTGRLLKLVTELPK